MAASDESNRRRGGGEEGRRRGGEESRRRTASNRGNSPKGRAYENASRRRGRPAWQRSPDDTPFRDGNRDRLLGLLTERAVKTLIFYFSELNPTLMQWLTRYLKENPIPRDGSWDDVSGETFLRQLLNMPLEETQWDFGGRPAMYSCVRPLGVDPRNLAQRIMDIRSQIAKEWVEELKGVSEDNSLLMRESLANSFSMENMAVADASQAPARHPDFDGWEDTVDNSAIGDDD